MINQAFVDTKSHKLFVERMKTFGEWLRDELKRNDISNAELARRVDVSATYIGNLVRDFSPNSKTGNIRASEPLVEKIARALKADINEARLAAGYASKTSAETIDIVQGIKINIDKSKYSEAEIERLTESMRVAAIGTLVNSGAEEKIFHPVKLKEIYSSSPETKKNAPSADRSEKQSADDAEINDKTISKDRKQSRKSS